MEVKRTLNRKPEAARAAQRLGRWAKWLLALLFWTLIGLSFASQFYSSAAKAGLEVTWKRAVTYALGDWYQGPSRLLWNAGAQDETWAQWAWSAAK